MKNLSPTTLGISFALLGFSIFAFTDLCLKMTSRGYDPFSIALYMNIMTSLCLIPVILYCGGFKKVTATKSLKLHILRSCFLLINFLCVIYAFSKLPLATAYTILFTMPFMLNILVAILFKEKISIHRWLAIILGFTGVLIAMRPGIEPINLAMIVILIGTLFNAGSATAVKFINKEDHFLSYTFYIMLIQTPILVAIALYRGEPLLPDFNDWSTMPWFIAGGAAFVAALSLTPQALQRADASIVGALIYIVFPWGIFYGYFIFKDVPDLWTIAGAMIIILSGLFLMYKEYTKNTEKLENK